MRLPACFPRSITAQITGIVAVSVLLGIALLLTVLLVFFDGGAHQIPSTAAARIADITLLVKAAESPEDVASTVAAAQRAGMKVTQVPLADLRIPNEGARPPLAARLVAGQLEADWGVDVIEGARLASGAADQLAVRLGDDSALLFETSVGVNLSHFVVAPAILTLTIVLVFVMRYVFTTYDRAIQYVPAQRKMTTYVLAAPVAGHAAAEVARRISAVTGLNAFTSEEIRASSAKSFIRNSPVPFIVGLIVGIGFVVGTVISGQTFFTFVLENTRHLGVLRAMGTQTRRLALMIFLQAMVAGLIGYALGIAIILLVVAVAPENSPLQAGLPALAAPLVPVLGICAVAALLGIRRMARIEPAIVFRA